jgi:acyl-coenzyme A synthetase/AMP-(fatty) acid ligase
VSPVEVEAALLGHPALIEAAVVGAKGEHGLIEPHAYVVLRDGVASTPELATALDRHVVQCLPPFKRPKAIRFVAALPKTATGKLQRFRLRDVAWTARDA